MVRRLPTNLVMLLASVVLAAGACSSSKPEPKNQELVKVLQQPPAPAPSIKAPCPEQLHDISGSLLLYYAVNKRLPATLAELTTSGAPGGNVSIVCPDSKKPYVYVPEGLTLPDVRGSILVYDPQPSGGWRWTIIMPEVSPPNAPVVKVVAVPESRFAAVPDK